MCVQVDGVNIQDYTNQQAVEILRHTGQTVNLKLVRRGFKPEDACPSIIPVTVETTPSSSRNSTMERTNTKHGTSCPITVVLLNECLNYRKLLTSVVHICLNTPQMYIMYIIAIMCSFIGLF